MSKAEIGIIKTIFNELRSIGRSIKQPIQDWRNIKLIDHVTDLIALYDKNITNPHNFEFFLKRQALFNQLKSSYQYRDYRLLKAMVKQLDIDFNDPSIFKTDPKTGFKQYSRWDD